MNEERQIENLAVNTADELLDYLIDLMDETYQNRVQSRYDKASKAYHEKQREIVDLESQIKVLEKEIDKREHANHLLEKRIGEIEGGINNTHFWEFGKRAELRQELITVKATPKEEVTSLYRQIADLRGKITRLYPELHKAERETNSVANELRKINEIKRDRQQLAALTNGLFPKPHKGR